ncbi:hypothetical protein RchiOBHm_Chr4g0429861 [Rosa chinensis]|uniref:Uncharacterized protein n=1 Tax=Rosa chinensis TaxID=74649 RepID=A0A2P6R0B0_ROSCH|nr:hypothetical protein RchiOBHm_Chr4g0429861 [Rosa chinensis]
MASTIGSPSSSYSSRPPSSSSPVDAAIGGIMGTFILNPNLPKSKIGFSPGRVGD